MTIPGFGGLHPTTRRLLLSRTLRSIGQGALVVDFSLYLHALHWSGFAIGLVLTGSGLFGAGLSLLVGTSSDRLGRKPFLLVYEGIVLFSSIAALLSAQPLLLSIATIAAGFGRGANGAAGPFAPVEQAWLAEAIAPARRGQIYSLNAALGFFGMGFGALLAIFPAYLNAWPDFALARGPEQALAYRPLFAVVGLLTVINLVLLGGASGAREERSTAGETGPETFQRDERARHGENRILCRLILLNTMNGLAVGLTSTLISYWFMRRFHVGPVAIAPMMAATFVITGAASLFSGRLTERIGIVRLVVRARLIGLALTVLLPLMPVYWLASTVFLLRSVFNRGSVGARQALVVGLVRNERRGLAASLNAVSMQIPQSAGPGIAGFLLDAGQFALPFYVAGLLQGIYLVGYGRTFRNYNLLQDDGP
ncbi:MAG: MFS transporter [Nitrospiraceae bacterium]|nr:MFS transporter [Nitrospiraceae bacterium]